MKICIFYSSPKLGDLVLQLPFFRAIATHYKTKVSICINQHISIKKILEKQNNNKAAVIIEGVSFRFSNPIALYNPLRDKNFNYAFIFEKTKGPALACKISI